MDGSRFDTLTRSLAVVGSRRRALAALGGALGLLGLVHPDDAAAAKSGKCKSKCDECQRCKRGKCKKTNGTKRCKKGKCQAKSNGTGCSVGNCLEGSCFPQSTCPATTTGFCSTTPETCSAPEAVCVCDRSTEGNVVCVTTRETRCPPAAGVQTCTSSADCPAGEACVDISGCCPAPAKVCMARCPAPTVASVTAAEGRPPLA